MANDALTAWSQKFLKALSDWNLAVSTSNRTNNLNRFNGRYTRPSAGVLAQLQQVCDNLVDILDTPNKTTILSSLKVIQTNLSKTISIKGDRTESYYTDLTNWYNNNIKPLL